jgi:hypothetical protein
MKRTGAAAAVAIAARTGPIPSSRQRSEESDDENTRVGSGLDDAPLARRDQARLGHDPDDLLDKQRGARQQLARVASLEHRVGFGAEQTQGCA